MAIKNKVKDLFYRSFLGGFYFEFLLWLDRRQDKVKPLSPKEIATIIREHSQINEGVVKAKQNINAKLVMRTKKNYEEYLSQNPDVIPYAEVSNSKSQVMDYLKSNMDLSNKDIKSDIEHARMIQKRIADYKELHEHIARRKALREARKNNGRS